MPESKTKDLTLAKVAETRKIASDSLVKLSKLNDFTCSGSLKQQISAFLQQSANTRDKLDDYKNSVISLIIQVIGEVK